MLKRNIKASHSLFVFGFSLLVLSFIFLPAQPVSAVSDEVQNQEINSTKGDVNQIKNVAAQVAKGVEKDKVQIEKNKARIKAEREKITKELENFHISEKDASEKVEIIREREETLRTQEVLLKEKLETYETVTRLIERKLQILADPKTPFDVFEREIHKAKKELESVATERKDLGRDLSILEEEIRYVEEDIRLKNILFELKPEGREEFRSLLIAQKDRLDSLKIRVDILKKLQNLINFQYETIQTHLDSLESELLTRFKKKLFTPQSFKIQKMEIVYLFLGVLMLFAISLVLKHKEKKENADQDLMLPIFRVFFIGGIVFLALYFSTFIFGYHFMAAHFGKLIILSTLLFFAAIYGHCFLQFSLRKLFAVKEDSEDRKRPYYRFVSFVARWGVVILFIYLILETWGAGFGGLVFIYEKSHVPFFSVGNFQLSIWLIVKAAFLIWVFIIISKILDRFLATQVYPKTSLDEGIQYAFSVAIKYLFLFTGIFTSLSVLGINLGALTVFAGTIGIGIGFGLQEIAKNFVSGIIILIERPIKVGDYVEIEGLPARVKSINARSSVVTTFDNIDVIVPNSEFMSQRIVNWSHSDKLLRLSVEVGVAYGTDTQLVKETLLEVATSHPRILKHPSPYVWFETFGDSSLNFKLLAWTKDADNRMGIKSDLNHSINKTFQEKQVTIPFPQRDLHIKSQDVSLKFHEDN